MRIDLYFGAGHRKDRGSNLDPTKQPPPTKLLKWCSLRPFQILNYWGIFGKNCGSVPVPSLSAHVAEFTCACSFAYNRDTDEYLAGATTGVELWKLSTVKRNRNYASNIKYLTTQRRLINVLFCCCCCCCCCLLNCTVDWLVYLRSVYTLVHKNATVCFPVLSAGSIVITIK